MTWWDEKKSLFSKLGKTFNICNCICEFHIFLELSTAAAYPEQDFNARYETETKAKSE